MEPAPVIISQSKEADLDRNTWKIAGLALVTVVFGCLASYYFNIFLVKAVYGYAGASVVWSVLFLSMLILDTVFIKNRRVLWSIGAISGIVTAVFLSSHLFPEPSLILVAGLVLYALVLASALVRGQSILRNSVRMRFFEISKNVLPKAVTALLICGSVLLYLNYFQWGNFNSTIGRLLVNATLDASAPIVQIWVPTVSFDDTVRGFFQKVAETELSKAKPDIVTRSQSEFQGTFLELPPAQKKQVIADLGNQFMVSLENMIGALNPDQPMRDELYRGFVNYSKHFSDQVWMVIGASVAFLFFISAKALAALFYWVVEGLAFLVFKFLFVVDFAHMSIETRSREFIVMD